MSEPHKDAYLARISSEPGEELASEHACDEAANEARPSVQERKPKKLQSYHKDAAWRALIKQRTWRIDHTKCLRGTGNRRHNSKDSSHVNMAFEEKSRAAQQEQLMSAP